MQSWARKYSMILLKAGLRLPLLKGYVDDGRQGSTTLRLGMVFNESKMEFVMDAEQYKVDIEKKEPTNIRMARICLPAMNAVNKSLKFTTESPEEFPRDRLPTLDFVLWLVGGILYHSYFEKEMKSQFTIMRRSAMSEQQKMSILSNELVRRLSNIHRDVLQEEIKEIIEHFITQLKNSGYERKQAREIVVCGVVGWRRKLGRREKEGKKQFLSASETLEKRTESKLLEKTNWYKEKNSKRKIEEKDSKYQHNPPKRRKRNAGKNKDKVITNNKDKNNMDKEQTAGKKIKAVMFVPYTKHSELAARLRENEEKMEQLTGYRMKIVEKGGTKLVDVLHKSNPWAGENCGRERCMLCRTKEETGKNNSQDCRKRNVVYETSCLTCTEKQDQETEEKYSKEGKKRIEEEKRKTKRYIYIGESNRSVYERGIEHQNDIPACKTSSHMLRHLLDKHEEEEENWNKIRFGMRILKSTRSAFERQILESVLIQKARQHNILNSKAEYNRCALPRLTAKLGERDLDKWRQEDRQEMEKEATIEEKIRMRKKEKSKRRAETGRRMDKGQPARKRRKGNEEDGDEEIRTEVQEDEQLETLATRSANTRTETPSCKRMG